MTTSTATRKVRSHRSPFAANPVRFCGACLVERSVQEQKDTALKGRCTECATTDSENLIAVPAVLTPPSRSVVTTNRFCPSCLEERPEAERADARLKGKCTDCANTAGVSAPARRVEETVEETAVRLTGLGLDPNTADVRRCGTCDANIAAIQGAEFCSDSCKAEAAAAKAVKTAKAAAKAAQPKPLPDEIRLTVRWSVRDDLTDHEIRVGLNNAWKLREGKRFTPAAVAAAARAWFEDYNRETFKRGARNTKVLRVLNAVSRIVD